jgi:hypothetical protein
MPFIAANSLLPPRFAAIYLHAMAVVDEFDTGFYMIQGVELLAGATNVTRMGLNLRDVRTARSPGNP